MKCKLVSLGLIHFEWLSFNKPDSQSELFGFPCNPSPAHEILGRMDLHKQALTVENYRSGYLIDSELMAGVTDDPDRSGQFVSFVIRPITGESLHYRSFPSLDEALFSINEMNRPWNFESFGSSGCAQGNCGTGTCDPSQCQMKEHCTDC